MPIFQRKSPTINQIPLTPTVYHIRPPSTIACAKKDRSSLLAPARVRLFDDDSSTDDDNNERKGKLDDGYTIYAISRSLHYRMAFAGFVLALFTFMITIAFNGVNRFHQLQNEKLPVGYLSRQEMLERAFRFPSVTDRVKVYMSSWYTPPCKIIDNINSTQQHSEPKALTHFKFLYDSAGPLLVLREVTPQVEHENVHSRVFLLDNNPESKGSRIFFMDPTEIRKCDHSFCLDTKKYLFPSLKRLQESENLTISASTWKVPVILQFGDAEISRAYRLATKKNESYPNIPIIKKFRYSIDRDELRRLTARSCYDVSGEKQRDMPVIRRSVARLQPIVSKLTYKRHFGMLDEIPQFDFHWSQKIDTAVWRGALTGQKRDGFSIRDIPMLSPKELCLEMHRCRLVLQTARTELVNAKLVGLPGKTDLIPSEIDGTKLYGEKLSYSEMLQHKAIIMLEGNDVSSGLKWALYSNSVVMTQPSTYTSWAMEELLEPWVHYIPLNEDLSDVEEKMQWIIENDNEAAQIAHRGTLWITDLIYHPNAQRDDESIFDETFRRYKAHFVANDDLIP